MDSHCPTSCCAALRPDDSVSNGTTLRPLPSRSTSTAANRRDRGQKRLSFAGGDPAHGTEQSRRWERWARPACEAATLGGASPGSAVGGGAWGVAACAVVGWLSLGNRIGSAPPNLAPGQTPSRAPVLPTPAPPVGMQRSATVVAVAGSVGTVTSASKSAVQAEVKVAAPPRQAVAPPPQQAAVTTVVSLASRGTEAVQLSEAERTAVALKEAMRPPPGTPVVGTPPSLTTPPLAAAAEQGGRVIPVSRTDTTIPPSPATGTLVLPARQAPQPAAPIPTSTAG